MKLPNTPDPDYIRTGALNIRAHAVQKVSHVYYMGLFRHILENRLAFGHRRRHHDIDGRSDRNHIQIDMARHKIDRVSHHSSAHDGNIRTQCAESLQMLVDGPASNGAAARKRHLRALILS